MLGIRILDMDLGLSHVRAPMGVAICGKTDPGTFFVSSPWEEVTCPECNELKKRIHAIGLKGTQICKSKVRPSFYTSTTNPDHVTCYVCKNRLKRGYKMHCKRDSIAELTPEPQRDLPEINAWHTLSPAEVRAICLLFEHGFSVASIADGFKDTSREAVYQILRGNTYKHVARPIYNTSK